MLFVDLGQLAPHGAIDQGVPSGDLAIYLPYLGIPQRLRDSN